MQRIVAALMMAVLLPQHAQTEETPLEALNPYVGLWVSEDGHIRHELLANGRYVEARGTREMAYQGRYEVTGTHIEYWDDTGFTADGDFINDVLHHAGMILYRQSAGYSEHVVRPLESEGCGADMAGAPEPVARRVAPGARLSDSDEEMARQIGRRQHGLRGTRILGGG